ncbi:MAG: immune inhibitor A, partial [Bacteroidia bacterium]|nr:immune inhibitor A [Bacteroidia bacterium]
MKFLIKSLCLYLCLGIGHLAHSQVSYFSKVRINFDDSHTLQSLITDKINVEGAYSTQSYIINDLSQDEIDRLRALSYTIDIIIEDVNTYYASQNSPNGSNVASLSKPVNFNCNSQKLDHIKKPEDFNLGSMGGYFTYDEILAELDSMHALYPNLISEKTPVSSFYTYEGRPVYYLKISDNASTDESEPKILYTAAHRSNAPISVSQLIFYMYYLLENYNTDPEIKAIVDNTELFFMPCVNPDGYNYNSTTYPNGGGTWSKNRHAFYSGTVLTADNKDSVGVDPLSNYAFNFGLDDFGSSGNITDYYKYRGPYPFSDAESGNVRSLCGRYNFNFVINHKGPGNSIVNPWSFQSTVANAGDKGLGLISKMLTEENGKRSGKNFELYRYALNGTPEDWFLGDQKILSVSCASGNPGIYYSPANEIIDQCKEEIYTNINAAKLCNGFGIVHNTTPLLLAVKNNQILISYNISNYGIDSLNELKVTLIPLDNNVIQNLPVSDNVYSGIPFTGTAKGAFAANVIAGSLDAEPLKFVLQVSNDYFEHTDTFITYVSLPSNLNVLVETSSLDSNFNSSTGWENDDWTFASPPYSISESAGKKYGYAGTNILKLNNTFDLLYKSDIKKCALSFLINYDIEPYYDYAQVQISKNNGANWKSLCGRYTLPGTEYQEPGMPLYDGRSNGWLEEEIDLSDYIGHKVEIRFLMYSDDDHNTVYDGINIDNLKLTSTGFNTTAISTINSSANMLMAIPNPFNNTCDISYRISESTGANLNITDITGRILYSVPVQNREGVIGIDLTGYSQGIYF